MPQRHDSIIARAVPLYTAVPTQDRIDLVHDNVENGVLRNQVGTNLESHDARPSTPADDDDSVEFPTSNTPNELEPARIPERILQEKPLSLRHDTSSSLNSFRNMYWARKLGKTALAVLILGNLIIILCVGALAFFWFADESNTVWHAVVVRDWMTKAITIVAKILKITIGIQIGTCSAMLAAIVLERCEVELENAASIALLRGNVLSSGAIFDLSQEQGWLWRMVHRWKFVVPLLITAFSLIFGFLQVITIVLVSDLGLVQVPAGTSLRPTQYGLTVNATSFPQIEVFDQTPTWDRKPQIYPAFAEHREDPFVEEGVDDTGMTIHSFLQFQTASQREIIHDC
ncbi:hypothetical protein K505DRAFT_381671, partial [Melanomma pulvis-pyrius CBS 109.77]